MSTLERISNIALIVTCTAVCTFLVIRNLPASRVSSPFKAGTRLKETAALELWKAPRTLLLFTASTCHFCAESMPFYRALSEQAQKAGTRILGITTELPATNLAYLEANGIRLETVLSTQESKLAVRGTPTVLVIKKDGTVLGSWQGRLGGKGEREVVQAVRGG